ncbi:MAG: hypothetical protein GY771_09350 [bacterium]|nr:hypothetical protein [bacterium]
MNRIIDIGPIIIVAAPLAALLLLFGIEKLSAGGGKPWVKLALAVNTCLLLLSGVVFGGNARAQDYEEIDCYDVQYVPEIDKFWENRSHPAFKEIVRLDTELTRAIDSGVFIDGLSNSIWLEVEDNIAILSKDGEITKDETAEIRVYFGERMDVYIFEVGGVTCYFFG